MDASGDTAFVVTQIRADESTRPPAERLFDDPFARLFRTPPAARESVARFLALPLVREEVRLRTRFIDDVVRSALGAGLAQLVLLGAGFDCRGLRLPELAAHNARVFEVDFAEQLARKHAMLAAGGVALPAHVRPVPLDLARTDFDAALRGALVGEGFCPGVGALFVLEGVLPYVSREAADRSLAFAARVGGAGSRVVLDHHAFTYTPEQFAARLASAGFTRCEDHGLNELVAQYLGSAAPPGAEACRIAVGYVEG